jgi:ABC-type multidrug transport system fused ATPase/permease subunit
VVPAGNALTAASAYTSLALFNLLRLPLAFLPMMVTMLVNALIALGRIRDFLLKPESGLDALRAAADATAPGLVQVEDASFTWEAEGTTASLHDVSFTAAPGTLTMIVGGVGSGKSSVLAALIGQMERLSGRVAVGGRVAYVAQTAWIVNDSVQVGGARGCGWTAVTTTHSRENRRANEESMLRLSVRVYTACTEWCGVGV